MQWSSKAFMKGVKISPCSKKNKLSSPDIYPGQSWRVALYREKSLIDGNCRGFLPCLKCSGSVGHGETLAFSTPTSLEEGVPGAIPVWTGIYESRQEMATSELIQSGACKLGSERTYTQLPLCQSG
ncbi:uncharacterized [Tachysurus ichikawai]